MEKKLYFGDNLAIIKDHISEESVDLIYLDPPFNSNADYNILFQENTGKDSDAQIKAFGDTWHWTLDVQKAYDEIIESAPADVVLMISALKEFVRQNDMLAYLVMMTVRLLQLKRILKESGSIYLHCDSTAVHYLKVVMDTIFGKLNFKNEIIWKRTHSHNDQRKYGRIDDRILFYSKGRNFIFNPVMTEYSDKYVKDFFHLEDERGKYQLVVLTGAGSTKGESDSEWRGYKPSVSQRHWSVPKRIINSLVGEEKAKQMSITERLDLLDENGYIVFSKNGIPRFKQYLDEMQGTPVQTIWNDINPLSAQEKERLGYPTQKPRKLLERIIKASADKNAVILDPFCGCGTTISACEYLNKNEGYDLKWIGIDITHLSIDLIKNRLSNEFNLYPKSDYEMIGEPIDLEGAKQLAQNDRYQFQWWVLSLVNARPYGDKKKGADSGIDGYIFFINKGKNDKAVVQVKSGKVGVKDIRDLKGVLKRDNLSIGIFITLEDPTKEMIEEANKEGFFKIVLDPIDYPKIQIITLEQLMNGLKPKIPLQLDYRKSAEIVRKKTTEDNLLEYGSSKEIPSLD